MDMISLLENVKEFKDLEQKVYSIFCNAACEFMKELPLVETCKSGTKHQILDYYFLQLCGYSGVSIKDEILKKRRDDFVKKLPDGTDDCSELHMAAYLLQYLCTSNDRISDGLNFIHTSIDVESCRRIFEKIFRNMEKVSTLI